MKRKIAAFAAGTVLLLGLGGCKPTPAPNGDKPTAPTVVLQDELVKPQAGTQYAWANNLPRMDGSTSTIPLEAGLRAALFGISQAEAELTVSHTTTYGSFENLINGNCDLIFSVPLSEEQMKQAADKNMELEMTKIAAEGFVFVVNAKNPVDTLTQQQLKDIYSGKIKNWKEVGGNDAPISAYQRNETSGSQNFMHTFMGDTPLMQPTTDFTPTSMGYLMDAIAVYDNAENAIGYSVYAYAADMYGNGNEIKFIKVDGVAPSKATMADGSYPLLGYNYAVYDKATPADSSLRQFVNWIASEEGQRAVKAAGYVPILPVGDLPETTIRLYTAVGTGPEKPADFEPAIYQYVASVLDKDIDGNDRSQVLIAAIKDDNTRKMVQDFVDESKEALTQSTKRVNCVCINGYLEIHVFAFDVGDSQSRGERTAIFDLVAGKRLISSDLYYKGVDFVTPLNNTIREEMIRDDGEFNDYWKREFIGLPAEKATFGLEDVTLEKDSVYTTRSISFSTTMLYGNSILSRPRDMSGLFDNTIVVKRQLAEVVPYTNLEKIVFGDLSGEVLRTDYYPTDIAEKINTSIRNYCRTEMSEEAMKAWCRDVLGDDRPTFEGGWANLQMFGSKYLFLSGSTALVTNAFKDFTPFGMAHFYDMSTGEEIPYTTFLKDGWEDAAVWSSDEYEVVPTETPDLSQGKLIRFNLTYAGGSTLTFAFQSPAQPYANAFIPDEYINWDA